jgi:hypothetical protein
VDRIFESHAAWMKGHPRDGDAAPLSYKISKAAGEVPGFLSQRLGLNGHREVFQVASMSVPVAPSTTIVLYRRTPSQCNSV